MLLEYLINLRERENFYIPTLCKKFGFGQVNRGKLRPGHRRITPRQANGAVNETVSRFGARKPACSSVNFIQPSGRYPGALSAKDRR